MIKYLRQLISHRLVMSAILIMLQIWLFLFLIYGLSLQFAWVYILIEIVGLVMVLRIRLKSDQNPAFNVAWIMIILGIPIIGPMLYLMFGNQKVQKELRGKSQISQNHLSQALIQNTKTMSDFALKTPSWLKLINYVANSSNYPVYTNTKSTYYGTGEEAFQAIVEALHSAQKTIFLEYFIIKPGIVFDQVLAILKEKAQSGVDVRVIFDDWGCPFLEPSVVSEIQAMGIKIVPFNRISHKVLVQLNNRDHRKILIVDGQIGFVSGINLADEYINHIKRFGYWKDNAVRLEGNAVLSLIEMFLIFWATCNNQPIESIQPYINDLKPCPSDGYIQPFADNPTDEFTVSESIHLNCIYNAKAHIRIVTPYLVIGYEMYLALKQAATSGVRVEIIVPGIPDKKSVYALTQSNYEKLVKAGVHVYTYTPGFIHQKMMVIDDEVAIVSTANMDFRSYYLNFECGVIFLMSKTIYNCIDDFEESRALSHKVTLADIQNVFWFKKLFRLIVGIFGQLM